MERFLAHGWTGNEGERRERPGSEVRKDVQSLRLDSDDSSARIGVEVFQSRALVTFLLSELMPYIP